ncbi:Methyltransferase domain [Teratosphaeria destructans]|uniref:Methyltransferase domain n=1 Tax=Teratosphaeria destructans TaxID=418781 RepID=A0A9W7SLJ2_9PEZI|nr:Methyltransferase domain [Teratosphaeria destructans]
MTPTLGPDRPLPYDAKSFATLDDYVDSLMSFVGTDELLRKLCGGVHILDFFTTEDPDLYSRVLTHEWREFFSHHEVMDILALLMRDHLDCSGETAGRSAWRDGPAPPESLLQYIRNVRSHLLRREPAGSQCSRNRAVKPMQKLARHVAVGMTIKKKHEVGLFAHYLSNLAGSLSRGDSGITHLVDFGSGQNYLGRALASEPYNHQIVAIESKSHNAERAKEFDVMAKLVEKRKIMVNKKLFRAGIEQSGNIPVPAALPTPPPEPVTELRANDTPAKDASLDPAIEASPDAKGRIQYVEHVIQDGDLTDVVAKIGGQDPRLMVMSLHSCGNLVHHGLRSMLLNPAVQAVAMVGCCYNLVTERLGPATYKLPELRPRDVEQVQNDGENESASVAGRANGARSQGTGEHAFRWSKGDPHGFPMSERMCNFTHASRPDSTPGIHLNITSRMMAVQAPQNWGPEDSESFFTRHFYRALLQRIFMDKGVVGPPSPQCVGGSPAGHSSGTPIIIGSLRKSCYADFVAYVRGALAKLYDDATMGPVCREKLSPELLPDDEIESYERAYGHRKKDLSVIWSLMAFSAGVIEAAIVVDRWLWLKEQENVKDAWVEPVFDYGLSPRNLVVVGVKE